MKTTALALMILAAWPGSAAAAAAQELRYWGRSPGTATGVIELGHGTYYEIAPGADIPGWGRVKEVTDDLLVVERARSAAEMQQAQERGALVHEAIEIHIPRHDLRLPRAVGPAERGR